MLLRKTLYDKLAAKVNNTDTSTLYILKQNSLNYRTKFPNVSSLATKTALTPVENKTPGVSSLVK